MPDFEHAVIGAACVLRPIGDFGEPEAAEALGEELFRYCRREAVCLVVNWERITQVKALALVALRTTEERMTSLRGCVRHCALSVRHKELLRLWKRTDKLADVFETEKEAIESCGYSERERAR
jgi:hypothetical protein